MKTYFNSFGDKYYVINATTEVCRERQESGYVYHILQGGFVKNSFEKYCEAMEAAKKLILK